jgi:hypothetical protein
VIGVLRFSLFLIPRKLFMRRRATTGLQRMYKNWSTLKGTRWSQRSIYLCVPFVSTHLPEGLSTNHSRNSRFLFRKTLMTQHFFSTKWLFARPRPFISWNLQSELVVLLVEGYKSIVHKAPAIPPLNRCLKLRKKRTRNRRCRSGKESQRKMHQRSFN